ncbi:dihydrodipicolinate synthase family protein [Mesorhizobium wenxiniae]|uniref:Dihydrodipicolinate synthase family protein n=1 Tax=Mesorhizobium wenxiniae TaxID=2014805 RepID=A0A271K8I7_9HYPH|nr:dihydrodipicolinate synthase family protein [Mesorhizobium wenxiniae]PAP92068.1 dihydrodipicolinate synthase family protein [Mesorhizobium wenxiniae]
MSGLTAGANGVYVIAVTPFSGDGSIDMKSVDRMVDFYLEAGATGLTALGMMGEAPKLTIEESQAVVRRIIARVSGRVPIVVGVSSPGFAQMHTLTKLVMDEGAAGVMIAPPSSLRTDDQIVSYFGQAAEFVGGVPWVLQDFPLATGVQISVSTISRIVADNPNCVCLKHEDWPGLDKIGALRDTEKLNRRIAILCGNGGIYLPEEMGRGADGAMTGFAYPEMMVSVVKHHSKGEMDRARDLFDAYLPLARFEQQPGLGLAVRKYVLAKRGVIAEPTLRRPGAPLSASTRQDIEVLVARQEHRLRELG